MLTRFILIRTKGPQKVDNDSLEGSLGPLDLLLDALHLDGGEIVFDSEEFTDLVDIHVLDEGSDLGGAELEEVLAFEVVGCEDNFEQFFLSEAVDETGVDELSCSVVSLQVQR